MKIKLFKYTFFSMCQAILGLFFLIYSASYFDVDLYADGLIILSIAGIFSSIYNMNYSSAILLKITNIENYVDNVYKKELMLILIPLLIVIIIIFLGFYTEKSIPYIVSVLALSTINTSGLEEITRLRGDTIFRSYYKLPATITRIFLLTNELIPNSLFSMILLFILPDYISIIILYLKVFLTKKIKKVQNKTVKIVKGVYLTNLFDGFMNNIDIIILSYFAGSKDIIDINILKRFLMLVNRIIIIFLNWVKPLIYIDHNRVMNKENNFAYLFAFLFVICFFVIINFKNYLQEFYLPVVFEEIAFIIFLFIFIITRWCGYYRFKVLAIDGDFYDLKINITSMFIYLLVFSISYLIFGVLGLIISLIIQNLFLLNMRKRYYDKFSRN